MKKNISACILLLVLILMCNAACTSSSIGHGANIDITIETGGSSSFMILSDGSLWAWGWNDRGQLGDGTTVDRGVPVRIMNDVIAVSSSSFHTMAIQADGSLWAWGYNRNGQLGDGTRTDRHFPVNVKQEVVAVSVGSRSTFLITTDGLLWGFGLGADIVRQQEHVIITDNVSYVSTGGGHTMVIKTDDSLWAWGWNEAGQLGDGTTEDRCSPVWIMDDVALVSAGDTHTMAIKNDGSLWGWGGAEDLRFPTRNAGQVGNGTTVSQHYPAWIMDGVITVSASSNHTTAIQIDGSLWSWGSNSVGQLGYRGGGSTRPRRVIGDVAYVSSGNFHNLAIRSDGSIWAWGWNMYGQLGDGTTRDRSRPVNITNSILTVTP